MAKPADRGGAGKKSAARGSAAKSGGSKTNAKPKAKAKKDSYGAKDITVLEGLEAVRKRPGMYIGSTGPRGLHHLVYEVVDNSVDEAIAGHANKVSVTLTRTTAVTVVDDGRGIPTGKHPKYRKPAAEVVLTTLHAGGKFGDGGGYKVSGGLHGVGISVVNALSERLDLEIWRDGAVWNQTYERGKPARSSRRARPVKTTGTTMTFMPDMEIFGDEIEFDFETLVRAPARDGLPHPRPQGRADRRARRRREGRVPVQGRHRGLRQAPERVEGPAAPEDRLLRGRDRRRARSRSRCSGTPPTRSRSSPSPTTSTPTRAARTCRASARR